MVEYGSTTCANRGTVLLIFTPLTASTASCPGLGTPSVRGNCTVQCTCWPPKYFQSVVASVESACEPITAAVRTHLRGTKETQTHGPATGGSIPTEPSPDNQVEITTFASRNPYRNLHLPPDRPRHPSVWGFGRDGDHQPNRPSPRTRSVTHITTSGIKSQKPRQENQQLFLPGGVGRRVHRRRLRPSIHPSPGYLSTKALYQIKQPTKKQQRDSRDLARAPYNLKDAQCAAHVPSLPARLSAVGTPSSSLSRSSSSQSSPPLPSTSTEPPSVETIKHHNRRGHQGRPSVLEMVAKH